jgi:hypothetical protein
MVRNGAYRSSDRKFAEANAMAGRWLVISLASAMLTGCGGGAAASVVPVASPVATDPAPSVGPTIVEPSQLASGPATLPVHQGGHAASPIVAGTYITPAGGGFFPGLTLSLPAGWTAAETDSGELALHPASRPDDAVLMWKDMAAVVTNDRSKTVGQVLPGVGRTAAALVKWLTTTKDFAILVKPRDVTVGAGIKGTELTLGVSATANFASSDCPDNPRCAAILTDPAHWGPEFYAIGGAEVTRIFVATASYPDGDHTFFVTLDAPNVGELARLAGDAAPIVASLHLPPSYVAN